MAAGVVQADLEDDAPDVTPVMQRRYEYDPAGNLTQILDPHKGNREYRYDKQHRLTEALHHPIAYPEALPQALRWRGISEQFTHDAAGNVLGNDAASRGTQVRSNLLKQKGDVRFEYDEFGNLTREVRSTKPLWVREFRYDCQHRLVEFIEQRQGQKTHFAYAYDAFGRRIQKQDLLAQRPNAITRFFWQGERMVAECADDDNIFTADDPKPAHLATYKSYLYSPGSFVPLAQLLGKGRQSEIYYYLNDHLGTPQELVNGKGQIAWSAAYRAYGNLAVAFVESVPQPLRFQGQYFDAESGLHYNRYRYYSPETARFITPDPIGLAGGLNQTQYVPNPTGWVDPLGLAGVPGNCPPRVNAKHIFHGEINNSGKAVGFHHERGLGHQGKARVTEITQPPNELGVYKGKVEIFNPATGQWVPKQFESTFFPKEWDRAKVLSEVKAAKANSVMVTSAKWRGTSPSGVTIEGYGNINTAFPVLE